MISYKQMGKKLKLSREVTNRTTGLKPPMVMLLKETSMGGGYIPGQHISKMVDWWLALTIPQDWWESILEA